jgi:integrase
MGEPEIGRFLSSLATEHRVSASTQNQAFNALLFLYKEALGKNIGLVEGVVLTKDEIKKVIDQMNGLPRLMAMLLYGGGLRLMECCRLRSKISTFLVMRLSFERAKVIKTVTQCYRQRSKRLFSDISKRIGADIKKTSRRDLVVLRCRMR